MSKTPSAVPTPPAAPATLRDHLVGAAVAAAATIVGAIATPFLALAWIALSPLLPFALAIRAISRMATGAEDAAEPRRAAA